MATLMRSSGKIEEVTPKNGNHFTLEELQSYVGGYIEVIYVNNDVMIVNEEGCLMCLPDNAIASEKTGIALVGNVLQLNMNEWTRFNEN